MIGVQIKRLQRFHPVDELPSLDMDKTKRNGDRDRLQSGRISARDRYNILIWERLCDHNVKGEEQTDESDVPWYIRDRLDVSVSRNTSRVQSESREAMFARAMKLLTARCTSVQPGMDTPFGMTRHELPFGVQVPQYFYIRQEKPTPMPPLKAWQGYNGNVYFEPIQISSVRDVPQKEMSTFEKSNGVNRLLMSQQKQLPTMDRPESQMTRTFSRSTGKTSSSPKSENRPLTRQMVLLDKRIVLDRYEDDITGDLQWIEGMENTGSLAVRPKSDILSDRPLPQSPKPPEQGKKTVYNKERICKGSVVHKLNMANKSNQPVFKVSGGKYSSPNNTSPLLRRQTQYSLSSQRLTTNTPDMSNQLFPPVSDHIRRTRPVTCSEDIKPFIKYSPEIKAKGHTGMA